MAQTRQFNLQLGSSFPGTRDYEVTRLLPDEEQTLICVVCSLAGEYQPALDMHLVMTEGKRHCKFDTIIVALGTALREAGIDAATARKLVFRLVTTNELPNAAAGFFQGMRPVYAWPLTGPSRRPAACGAGGEARRRQAEGRPYRVLIDLDAIFRALSDNELRELWEHRDKNQDHLLENHATFESAAQCALRQGEFREARPS